VDGLVDPNDASSGRCLGIPQPQTVEGHQRRLWTLITARAMHLAMPYVTWPDPQAARTF
jgi:hypothetical protein